MKLVIPNWLLVAVHILAYGLIILGCVLDPVQPLLIGLGAIAAFEVSGVRSHKQ